MPKVTFLPGAKDATDPNRRNAAKTKAAYVPSFSQDKPSKPKDFTKEESRHFDELCDRLEFIGLNSVTFEAIIINLAKNLALEDRIRKDIADKQLFYGPSFAALKAVDHQVRMGLKDLALTPGEHARIGLRRAANPRGSQSTENWEDM